MHLSHDLFFLCTAESGTWFEGISGRASPMVTLPPLPITRSKDLIRGDDLLLALAGQLSLQVCAINCLSSVLGTAL